MSAARSKPRTFEMATGGLFGQGGGFSSATVSDAGGAVSDLFAAQGDLDKKQGDLIEQGMYQSDASLATQNAQFTQQSTAIKVAQQSRANFQSQSETEANVAGAGFANSGSSLDILANNASQGALTQQVLQQQGLITRRRRRASRRRPPARQRPAPKLVARSRARRPSRRWR
jgi:hypothetical protein